LEPPRDRKTKTEQRVEILLKVEYREPSELLSDYLTSLGGGGLFINTSFPFAIGDRLSFSISFPGLLEQHEFEGVVRWRRAPGPDTPAEEAGLGVEFLVADAATRGRLAALLESLRAENHGPLTRPAPFRVLLVEDNDLIQDLFAYAVRCYHFDHGELGVLEIHRAADGLAALRILEESSVDLAIVDHFLPAMTGSALVRRIRAMPRYARLPVLVLSVGDEEVKREALAAGADLFLHKPVLNKQLVRTIATLLSRTTP
jgi:uncharacterized protein (TIGR02266 family)